MFHFQSYQIFYNRKNSIIFYLYKMLLVETPGIYSIYKKHSIILFICLYIIYKLKSSYKI
jgi:hypothetical protein